MSSTGTQITYHFQEFLTFRQINFLALHLFAEKLFHTVAEHVLHVLSPSHPYFSVQYYSKTEHM